MEVEMRIRGLMMDPVTNMPIVLLKESDSETVLPIWVGIYEANAIALEIEKVCTPRPMTHDLLKNLLDELQATLQRLDITSLSSGTFYAEMHLTTPTGEIHLSCRPSDGIALALRTGSPVFAAAAVVDEAGYTIDDDTEAEDVVEQFREFIDSVDPEDFAS